MVLEKDWQAVTDEYGQAPVPGRGLARITGRLVRIQGFRLDPPREHPELEVFYPPVTTPDGRGGSTGRTAPKAPAGDTGAAEQRRSGTLPTTTSRWAPNPPPEPAPSPAGAVDDPIEEDALTPRYGIPIARSAPPDQPGDDGPSRGDQRRGIV
jgi:hypothetical protein